MFLHAGHSAVKVHTNVVKLDTVLQTVRTSNQMLNLGEFETHIRLELTLRYCLCADVHCRKTGVQELLVVCLCMPAISRTWHARRQNKLEQLRWLRNHAMSPGQHRSIEVPRVKKKHMVRG